jgi:hypothetical protein
MASGVYQKFFSKNQRRKNEQEICFIPMFGGAGIRRGTQHHCSGLAYLPST